MTCSECRFWGMPRDTRMARMCRCFLEWKYGADSCKNSTRRTEFIRSLVTGPEFVPDGVRAQIVEAFLIQRSDAVCERRRREREAMVRLFGGRKETIMMPKALLWLIDNVPMGRLAPWVFGLAIGRVPHRIDEKE